MDYGTKCRELREHAISKWLDILKLHSLQSDVGQQILSSCNVEKSMEAKAIVDAVLGVRSPTTAITRANAMLRFLRWAAEDHPDGCPLSEDAAWR